MPLLLSWDAPHAHSTLHVTHMDTRPVTLRVWSQHICSASRSTAERRSCMLANPHTYHTISTLPTPVRPRTRQVTVVTLSAKPEPGQSRFQQILAQTRVQRREMCLGLDG